MNSSWVNKFRTKPYNQTRIATGSHEFIICIHNYDISYIKHYMQRIYVIDSIIILHYEFLFDLISGMVLCWTGS